MRIAIIIIMGFVTLLQTHEYYGVLYDADYPQLKMDAFKNCWKFQSALNFRFYCIGIFSFSLLAIFFATKRKMKAATAFAIISLLLMFAPPYPNI